MQSRSAGHHWKYRVFLFHHEIDQRSASALSRFTNRGRNLVSSACREPEQSEGLSELGEVRTQERCRGIAAVVEKLLPLPDHAQISVVDDSDVQINPFLSGS